VSDIEREIKIVHEKSGSNGELANASVVRPPSPGSNLCIDINYFLILFVCI
jgi:hypothetical protein